jgi:ElaB/YqjD/DUF883 family membrane-anchored ribosome-binding protein
MAKKDKKIDFNSIVKNRKLPILTLDARWHELFPEDNKTAEIKDLELKLNNLLKRQGKMVNDIKDMKRLKNNLLKDIMDNMDTGKDHVRKDKDRKLDKNKQYINELNEKITSAMNELADIPYLIKEANEALMVASMDIFYSNLERNKAEIKEISDWIAEVREELKTKILVKQDMETKNTLLYSYMHDILGADIMEAFDKGQQM